MSRRQIRTFEAAVRRLDAEALHFERMAELTRDAASKMRVVIAQIEKEEDALDAEYGRSCDTCTEYGPRI